MRIIHRGIAILCRIGSLYRQKTPRLTDRIAQINGHGIKWRDIMFSEIVPGEPSGLVEIRFSVNLENPTMIRVAPGVAVAVIAFSVMLFPGMGYSQDVIAKRQDLMENADEANKAIRAAAKQKDYATLEAKAKVLVDGMSTMTDLFPKGSLSEKSEAHPDIWVKWDEFRDRARKATEAAAGLMKAAAAKDDAQVMAQVKAIGGMRSGACGGCHLSFNKKRMDKPKP